MSEQRYKLTIAYRGTWYHGWQAQMSAAGEAVDEPGDSEFPTVQETLAEKLTSVLGHRVHIVGSSRTDAGVHAKGQVAHFDTTMTQIPPENLRRAVNARLPDDILIRGIEPVAPEFNAVSSTLSKRYQYFIWNAPDRPTFFSDLSWHRWSPLDAAAMHEALQHLVGEHDFASFAKPGHGRTHTVRTILSASVRQRAGSIVVGIEGTGFLWNMIRIIVGTLVEVGAGRHRPEALRTMLEARDRRAAGPTAPAHGLFLQWIKCADLPAPARSYQPPAQPISLRVLHDAYWPGVLALARTMPETQSPDHVDRLERDLRFQNGFVACIAGRVLGYVCFNVRDDAAELTHLAVDPAHRRQGIARALVQRVVNEVRPHGIRRLRSPAADPTTLAVLTALGFTAALVDAVELRFT